VLFHDADSKRESLVAALRARPSTEEPLRAIRESVVGMLASLEHDRDRNLAQSRILASSPTLQRHRIELEQSWDEALLQALLVREERAGGGRSRFELRLVASTAVAALRAAAATWLEEGGDLVGRVDAAFDSLSHGLAVTPGTRRA